MKFGPVSLKEAVGCILAHKTNLPGRVLKKGHVLSGEDCRDLASQGIASVVAARLEDGDVGENDAATRLGLAAKGRCVSEDSAFTGRMNLYADAPGVLVVDTEAVTEANRIDPAITFATLPDHSKVSRDRMIATAKIISFAVSGAALERAEGAVRGAVRVAEFQARKVGLVATKLPHLKPVTMDKTRRVLEDRLRPSGSTILAEERVPHASEDVSAAMKALVEKGADFLVLFGASAVVDRHDVLPAAVDLAGGSVAHLGMPVDPGNLLMLAELDGIPVLGAPGCARSPKENGFDWVLDRLLAGVETGPDDVTAMGVGGLLMEIGTRPQPREAKRQTDAPKVAAIILGAGKSTRMGGPNKLLATLDGKALVRHAGEAAIGAGLRQTILVTGHLADEVRKQVEDLDIETVYNPDYADGMATSIRAGMKALEADTEAVIVLLGDMPRVGEAALKKLIAAYKENGTSLIVAATANGKRGNPVLWDKRFFDDLNALTGDIGARHLIARNPGFVAEVEIGSAARLDLDTPQALQEAGGALPGKEG
ncbi:molybdopterin-binding/glycosyltransferase family 2 protein [uncultured Roseibium sp.]|uniref:molybdopterin-binding/glycosyltransferase family 2 protein n=1 Tax=uncultured Roseibium sp. TaxID=1936171 RepID=UPI0026203525|nr:molybdopterin-binding/glycosyltransferase family 2 protein [uncultured Roseibium sp.]